MKKKNLVLKKIGLTKEIISTLNQEAITGGATFQGISLCFTCPVSQGQKSLCATCEGVSCEICPPQTNQIPCV